MKTANQLNIFIFLHLEQFVDLTIFFYLRNFNISLREMRYQKSTEKIKQFNDYQTVRYYPYKGILDQLISIPHIRFLLIQYIKKVYPPDKILSSLSQIPS